MVKRTVSLGIVFFSFVLSCYAANILILGMPFYRHLFGPANVGRFLRSQGHDVRIAIPPQLEEKLKDHCVKFLLYHCLADFPEDPLLRGSIFMSYFATTSFLQSLYPHAAVDMKQIVQSIATKIVKDVQLLQSIENFSPDLILLDSGPSASMLTLIPYKLDIPFIMIGSEEFPQCTRTPIIPTVFPFKNYPYTDHMTFQERIYNTLMTFQTYWNYPYVNLSLIDDFAPEKPYITPVDLQAKAQMWIVRQHSVFSYNPPSMPNVKRVGHLLALTSKPLPPELELFLESADKGVVVVSFGTVLTSVPSQVMDKLLTAFKETAYKFIIQSSALQNKSDKFLFRKWLPQFDLLCHKKTKLFITHCGSNGLQEALIAGVPIIGFPIFADQPHNAGKVVRKGFGLKLSLRSFSVEELVLSIKEVTTNSSFKANVEKASAILKAEQVPPVEEAAFWINHILSFGGDHLRSYAQDIPMWKYLGLDIIAFFLVLWHIFVYLFIILLKCCLSHCFKSKQKLKGE